MYKKIFLSPMAAIPKPEKKIRKESRPEKYLREIRDLQKKNLELLTKLTTVEEKRESRRIFFIGGKALMILLPYLFSMFVAWAFYAKVQDTVQSLQTYITQIPSAVSEKFNINIDTDQIKDSAIEKGTQYYQDWKNKNNDT